MLEFVIPVWDVFPFFKIKVFKIKYATANTNNSITGTKLYLSGIIKPTILVTKNPKAQSKFQMEILSLSRFVKNIIPVFTNAKTPIIQPNILYIIDHVPPFL